MDIDFEITYQMLEIYRETVNDLLSSNNKNLQIKESTKRGIYVDKLT